MPDSAHRPSRLPTYCRLCLLWAVILFCACAFTPATEGGSEAGPGPAVVKRGTPLTPEEEARAAEIKAHVYESLAEEDREGFMPLGPPRAGEWLAQYKEFPQTLERYEAIDVRSRPSEGRKTVVLQPLGEFSREQRALLEVLRAYAAVFFQAPARLEKPIEVKVADPEIVLFRRVPMGQRHGEHWRQLDAAVLLKEVLAKRVPADAFVYVGITAEDLWTDRLNYLFGMGSFTEPTAVFSLSRFYPDFDGRQPVSGDELRILRRVLKILNHEASHVFGLRHCVFYQCTMNGCNSRPELDAAPIHLCPVCHRKLCWALGWDAGKRYDALSSFYQRHGLEAEADWAAKRLKCWRAVEAGERAARGGEEE